MKWGVSRVIIGFCLAQLFTEPWSTGGERSQMLTVLQGRSLNGEFISWTCVALWSNWKGGVGGWVCGAQKTVWNGGRHAEVISVGDGLGRGTEWEEGWAGRRTILKDQQRKLRGEQKARRKTWECRVPEREGRECQKEGAGIHDKHYREATKMRTGRCPVDLVTLVTLVRHFLAAWWGRSVLRSVLGYGNGGRECGRNEGWEPSDFFFFLRWTLVTV